MLYVLTDRTESESSFVASEHEIVSSMYSKISQLAAVMGIKRKEEENMQENILFQLPSSVEAGDVIEVN